MQIEVVLEPLACLLGFLEKEGEGGLERATGWLAGWGGRELGGWWQSTFGSKRVIVANASSLMVSVPAILVGRWAKTWQWQN